MVSQWKLLISSTSITPINWGSIRLKFSLQSLPYTLQKHSKSHPFIFMESLIILFCHSRKNKVVLFSFFWRVGLVGGCNQFCFSTDALLTLLCFMCISSLSHGKFYVVFVCSSWAQKVSLHFFKKKKKKSFSLEVFLAYLSLFIELIHPLQHNY